MNMANNANISAMNETMSTANAEMRQALVATQQQVAELAKMINRAIKPLHYSPQRGQCHPCGPISTIQRQ